MVKMPAKEIQTANNCLHNGATVVIRHTGIELELQG